MSAQLLVISGPDKGRSFPLCIGTTQVGRSTTTDTKLTDGSVSRIHCSIEYDGKRAVLANLSGQGTHINGRKAEQHELRHGDVVRVGGTEFRFQLAAMEEAETVMQVSQPTQGGKAQDLTALPGQVLAHFSIQSVLARGTSGVVFNAIDTRDGSTVALKVLQQELSRIEEEVQRFIRAMKTVLPLEHPHLVRLLGAGKSKDLCWIAMEHIDGESMTQVINRIGVAGMLDWKYGYRVAVHVGRALEYAHGQAIIHRNVTPANILLRSADKTALLGDLMLAKAMEGNLSAQLTRAGALLGDIAFMSPERTRGTTDLDARSDIYGLGATVYALIAGRVPFSGSMPEQIAKIRTAEPEPPRKFQMSIPDLFQGTVLKMMAKDPNQRFQTAAELLADLERVGKFAGASA